MFLEKLEIQGFKSFAGKNVLVFPGMLAGTKRGITAIVGPNGSGKSNVADAVRWALGEQSMKQLRGRRSEDVIFSGSDKKGKLGMAEVSLYLNNEDRKADLDYSQIVLTRRLYRNGESEYLINNSRARLFDIQMMLAKAKFGQKTYSVIGQGMVEGFLNTSLSERKEFFDEATGVKQYQIKRDDSLSKLHSSYENLMQAQMLINEIEPRLKSLTRQVGKLRRRGELESELKVNQIGYYRFLWHDIYGNFSRYNSQFLELEKEKMAKEKKLLAIERELDEIKESSDKDNRWSGLQKDLHVVQAEKDELTKRLAKVEAQMEIKLEAAGQFDLSFLRNKKNEIAGELVNIAEEIKDLETRISADKERGGEINKEREKNEAKIKELNQKLINLGRQADTTDVRAIDRHLKSAAALLKAVFAESDLEKIKSLAREIENEIAGALSISEKYESGEENGDSWGRLQTALIQFNGAKEELITKINENNLRVSARSERVKLLLEKVRGLEKETGSIEAKLKEKEGLSGLAEAEKEQEKLKEKIAAIDRRISEVRADMNQITVDDEKKRHRLFSLQKDLVDMQSEINDVSNRLNEIKINSTRYETKLEDLEIEIRGELGGLAEIKKEKPVGEVNLDEAKEKIGQIKRQLDLIGGIDPAIEKEYEETKERYEFLSGQAADLNEAISSLEKIVKELDVTIKERFDKEFKVISEKFEEYFKILFNGGNAKIVKVMAEEEPAFAEETISENEDETGGNLVGSDIKSKSPAGREAMTGAIGSVSKVEDAMMRRIKFLQKHNATGLAGIEIQATPPGKKIKQLSMLSGGERALTAIAMICAIISANPSPFVVLDEVDASLDEANSERLAKILDELSHKTQFIVITHNRASMRKANTLYGITMSDDGVSKLLSIKLDEVKVE